MYAVILKSKTQRRELLKLPLFASLSEARMFCRGFQLGLSEEMESASTDEPLPFRRGARFAFSWQQYATIWQLDVAPHARVEGV